MTQQIKGNKKVLVTDILVIGSGAAGANFALHAAGNTKITLVCKGKLEDSNTNKAQGGLAAVMDSYDSFAEHIQDTLTTGVGLCREETVQIVVEEAPGEIRKLLNNGMPFTMENKKLLLSREGGHNKNRVCYAEDDTGAKLAKTLLVQLREQAVTVLENHFVLELITLCGKDSVSAHKRCVGAHVVDGKGNEFAILSKAIVLATGGAGQLYQQTSNPEIATADGVALAYRAGAVVEDMEFVQFHPTALCKEGCPNFLISETVRGEGGLLYNTLGERFMLRYHEMKELAPRDEVARAIHEERKKGEVYLDIRHKGSDYILSRFPMIHATLFSYGIDMTKEMIPIAPAAHYMCGGVKVDCYGQTSISGLYAIGEVSCTGLHGANRLASNSLIEALVFGKRCAAKILEELITLHTPLKQIFETLPSGIPGTNINEVLEFRKELQSIMSSHVGIIRTEQGLREALVRLRTLEKKLAVYSNNKNIVEIKNMILVGYLIAKAALFRRESRGTHFRQDYPHLLLEWLVHYLLAEGKEEVCT